jgi:hypothetical protein
MRTIEKVEATGSLVSYAEHAEEFPLVITDQGLPIAALMPVPNADMETISLSTNPEFLSLISRSREHQQKQGGVSSQDVRHRMGATPDRPGDTK